MADFTAVIRRAVEGLPEQSPELRARVYEKARSAVVRQMENMSPPPPEALIKRQIDKIDAAIAEVESEFAEALPPGDDATGDEPVAEERHEAPPEDIPADEPVSEPEERPAYAPEEGYREEEAFEPADEREAFDAAYREDEQYRDRRHDAEEARQAADEDDHADVSVRADAPVEHVLDDAADEESADDVDDAHV